MTRIGVDVASWQHPHGAPIDWEQVRGANVEWVAIKLSELPPSGAYVNHFAFEDAKAALALGMECVVYHFCHPAANDPWTEAAFFDAQAKKMPTGVQLALDVEDGSQIGWGALQSWMGRFVDRTPCTFVYWNMNYRQHLTAPQGALEWIAAPGRPYPPQGTHVWQYGQGQCPGVEGDVDLNYVLYDRVSEKPLAVTPTTERVAVDHIDQIDIVLGPCDSNGCAYNDIPDLSRRQVLGTPLYNGTLFDGKPENVNLLYDKPPTLGVESYDIDGVFRIELTGGRPNGVYMFQVSKAVT